MMSNLLDCHSHMQTHKAENSLNKRGMNQWGPGAKEGDTGERDQDNHTGVENGRKEMQKS